MPFAWETEVVARLFDPESLLAMFPYMCKIEGEGARQQSDPITSTAVVFLTCPLQLCLTEVGAMPFAGRCSLVYPYNLMSDSQKEFLRDALRREGEWNVYNDAVVFRRSKEPVLLPPAAVLIAVCQKVFESGVHTQTRTRVALCNIILQRLQGHLTLVKPVQRELRQWLERRLGPGTPGPAGGGGAA